MGVALFLWRTIRTQRYRRHETAQHPQDTENDPHDRARG
jgi:hypothetical protein